MRRTGKALVVAALAAVLTTSCTLSLSSEPVDDETATPRPSTSNTAAPEGEGRPVARGMVFGDQGEKVTVRGASDRVRSSPEARRLRKMRERVQRIADKLQGNRPLEETAALTGTSADFGSFTYRYYADGRIEPDPSWVAEYIRTESVPILGEVRCHKLMLPQLRGALQQVVDSGLAGELNAGEYGGCYVPRFIGWDPHNPVSLHTWGIAIDLNVPGNQRGTVGEIDREVVNIFKSWGFAWGGDWDWTDPMHFELAELHS